MDASPSGFFAYPSDPPELGATIKLALTGGKGPHIKPWEELDIPGRFIQSEVIGAIDEADVLFADITVLNFNVTYEIGYAIGSSRRVIPVRYRGIEGKTPTINEVGIFDTLGYREYSNADELREIISTASAARPIEIPDRLNRQAPVYLIETKVKTDWMTRVVSRVKKSRLFYREFDPNEEARLSANSAIANVAQSYGIVVTLVAKRTPDSAIHNLRAAFIAGLAAGLNKTVTILQADDSDPIPIDFRDFVITCRHPRDIDDAVAAFAAAVTEAMQAGEPTPAMVRPKNVLERIDLGASSAENEIRFLDSYYLRTDAYQRTERGEVNIVVGRKGAGKSAVFFHLRNRARTDRGNVVVDLKPEGYKLVKFNDQLLTHLDRGSRHHTIAAFWDYVLLLEICYRVLVQDKELHVRDHTLYDGYQELSEQYGAGQLANEGDFSERMSALIDSVVSEYKTRRGDEDGVALSAPEVTHLIFRHDVRALETALTSYLRLKKRVWLLFDNLDKGWPTTGVDSDNLLLIRALLDACRKLEQELQRLHVDAKTVVFLRNDVYELLVKQTSDRGKEASVLIDWTHPDLLRELLRLRLVSGGVFSSEATFEAIWSSIADSHVDGEESSSFLIECALHRPRFLINLINHCKSFAINLRHQIITAEDIRKGAAVFSNDLVTDINYEIRDVFPEVHELLFAFISSPAHLSSLQLSALLREYGVPDHDLERVRELLIWFGFLGLQVAPGSDEVQYIHTVNYSMAALRGLARANHGSIEYVVHPAFWPGLLIRG